MESRAILVFCRYPTLFRPDFSAIEERNGFAGYLFSLIYFMEA